MSQASEFLKKIGTNEEFARELQIQYVIATVKFASSKGYSFTPDEYVKAANSDEQDLSPQDLEAIAGGCLNPVTMAIGEGGGGGLLPTVPNWDQFSF